ncbi:hypothetical protein GF345_02905 [Candidatus Woesearchaeota archaeon]|nr:hypothetical protein [Candidatus Woesearchaeota archaeon]
MNIERMQKINDLAQQLVEKGVYENLTDATQHAEVMLNKGDSGISSVFGTEDKGGQAQTSSDQQSSGSSGSQSSSGLSEEEIRMQLRKLNYQVNDQARTIKDLKEQINSLLNDIEKMKGQPKQNPVMERTKEDPQTHLSKEATEKKPHARSGNYESNDVSIEQFFYSGPPKG